MTCHWHHYAAKRESGGGFKAAHDRFLKDLVWAIRYYQPEVLAGDFNMGLFSIAAALRREALNVEMACWFAWQCIREGGAIAEEVGDGAEELEL